MIGGRVDRRGSREGKKSLRKNKQAVHDVSVKSGKVLTVSDSLPKGPRPPPPPISAVSRLKSVDCGCRLTSRQFSHDFPRFLSRMSTCGVTCGVTFSPDFDKQSAVLELCEQNSGTLFAAVGVHPDNVKRTNDKLAATQCDAVREMVRKPVCVAVLCGLDFSREFATRFPQEKLFRSQLQLAEEAELPVMVCVSGEGAAERACELVRESDAVGKFGGLVHALAGSREELDALLQVGLSVSFSGALLCAGGQDAYAAAELAKRVPRERLLMCTDSPFATPQCIEDVHVRDSPNEPANLPWVAAALANAVDLSEADLLQLTSANAARLFRLSEVGTEGPNAVVQQEREQSVAAELQTEQNEEQEEQANSPIESQPEPVDSPEVAIPAVVEAPSAPAPQVVVREESLVYACKMCRTELFSRSDLVAHGGNAQKDVCSMLFVRPTLEWLPNGDTSAGQGEGKLACPQCGSKIGRFALTVPMTCSCGVVVEDTPAFRVMSSRVDRQVRGGDAAAAARRAGDGWDPDDDLSDDEEDDGCKKKRKKKKVQKAKHSGNFSSFRNKTT